MQNLFSEKVFGWHVPADGGSMGRRIRPSHPNPWSLCKCRVISVSLTINVRRPNRLTLSDCVISFTCSGRLAFSLTRAETDPGIRGRRHCRVRNFFSGNKDKGCMLNRLHRHILFAYFWDFGVFKSSKSE